MDESPPPAPDRRGQPSPLVFYLAAALAAYQQALLAAPQASDARFPWAPHLREAAAGLGELDRLAVAGEIGARLSSMLRGLQGWQAHPYRRTLPDPPAIWSAGASRLLDYGQAPGAKDPVGPPVLVVPSLINRAYILDLMPGRSLLRWLAAEGFRPVLLDWGEPGREERGFDVAAYGERRLVPAFAHLREVARRPVAVLGYCMGGTFSVGLAARAPEGLAALATIGAPWEFGAVSGLGGGLRAMLRGGGPERLEALLAAKGEAFGVVPCDFFQFLFALLNPMQVALKFQKFARLDPGSAEARHFVAVEDWLADGVPMASRAARDLLVDWQLHNLTARGEWHFLGGRVRAEEIAVPMLAVCGQGDSIAPASMALPLPRRVPGARIVAPPTGHVGMVVGSAALAQVWQPLAEFLGAHG